MEIKSEEDQKIELIRRLGRLKHELTETNKTINGIKVQAQNGEILSCALVIRIHARIVVQIQKEIYELEQMLFDAGETWVSEIRSPM